MHQTNQTNPVSRLLVLLPVALMFLISQASYGQNTSSTRLDIVGSTTVLPIAAQAAKAYRLQHPELTLTVSGGGSGVGVASIKNHSADLGMVSRELTPAEAKQLATRVDIIPVARDSVAVAISKHVYLGGVKHLSLAQIRAIYQGEIHNWKEVGGPDQKILVIDKEASRGTRHVFAKTVLGHAHARAPGASIITGSNNEEQAIISKSDRAIGMLSTAWLNDDVRAIAIDVSKAHAPASLQTVTDPDYPIQRTLNILRPKNASASTLQFVDFILSKQGQDIVRSVGYLPIQPTQVSIRH